MGFIGPIRYAVSTAILTASAPNFFLLWSGWRGVSLVLPDWIYQAGDDFLYSLYQKMVLFFFEHTTGLEVYLSGDVEALKGPKENVIYLANHQSTVDWICCNILAARQGSIGHLRYFMKDTLQALPLYGIYFYEHGCIYVKRGNFKQHKSEKMLHYLRSKRIHSWIVVFPEGTRFIPEKKSLTEKSRKFAETQGFLPLNHLLTPRHKGSFLAIRELRSNLDAVYDVTITYAGTTDSENRRIKAPHLIDFLWGKCPQIHFHLRRIPIAEVPIDETNFKSWMHELFVEKDMLMDKFYPLNQNQVKWPIHKGKLDQLPVQSTLPSLLFFLATFIPYYLYPRCASVYWKTLVFGTLGGYSWLALKAVC